MHLGTLRPASRFQVVQRADGLYIDPRSYERFDRVAAAAASIDPAGASRLYATLKPRIEEAYRELGAPDGTFDRALERAIVVLLKTPVIDKPSALSHREGPGLPTRRRSSKRCPLLRSSCCVPGRATCERFNPRSG